MNDAEYNALGERFHKARIARLTIAQAKECIDRLENLSSPRSSRGTWPFSAFSVKVDYESGTLLDHIPPLVLDQALHEFKVGIGKAMAELREAAELELEKL